MEDSNVIEKTILVKKEYWVTIELILLLRMSRNYKRQILK